MKETRPKTEPNTYLSGSKTPRNMAQLTSPGDAHRAAMQDELKSSEELIAFLESKLE